MNNLRRIICRAHLICTIAFINSLLINQSISYCQPTLIEKDVYIKIMDYANNVKVIDTHEHQHWPEEYAPLPFNFYHLLQGGYLMNDVISAGSKRLDWEKITALDNKDGWELFGQALNYSRNTSYYGQLVKGFQRLYDFDDKYFTKSNIPLLSSEIEKNYADYRTWFDVSFRKAGFELMFKDQYWNYFNTEIDTQYYALVFRVNPLIKQISSKPSGNENIPDIYIKAQNGGIEIDSLDDYLAFCDKIFQKNIEKKAVSIKNGVAYSRSLDFVDIPYESARILFDKPSAQLSQLEEKQLQDFMFHRIIEKAIQYDLPIQIHTGYLAGNGNVLDNGNPVRLNNLFLKYPKAKFILFHGGFPWTGIYTAFGKMFQNVYLDIVWLPQISRHHAIQAFDEMLDCVPYNKFFWGGDCKFIEESTGSLEYGKEIVAEVLSRRIERGLLTEEVAFEIVRRIFRENAIEVFQLEQRLGRKF